MNIFKTQYLYTRHSWNTRHHFLCPAWSLTGNSPFVSCEKERSGARDEGIYQWVRVRILFVVNSRLLVLARMKTPKKSHNILENAFFDTAVMSGVRIFAVNAAFEKPRSAQFVLHPTKRNALSFPDFCQKTSFGVTLWKAYTVSRENSIHPQSPNSTHSRW